MTTRAAAVAIAVLVLVSARDARASAPDPTIAALISTAATVVPMGVTAGLWLNERGTDEGIRFDLGLVFLGVGSIVGPSTGQIYAQAEGDAWVTFILRGITGGVMVTGVGFWARGDSDGAKTTGTALTFIGGVPTLLLAIYDIVDSSSSAVRAAHRSGHSSSAALDPALFDLGDLSLCEAVPHAEPCRAAAELAIASYLAR
jgi:hypothetical protein